MTKHTFTVETNDTVHSSTHGELPRNFRIGPNFSALMQAQPEDNRPSISVSDVNESNRTQRVAMPDVRDHSLDRNFAQAMADFRLVANADGSPKAGSEREYDRAKMRLDQAYASAEVAVALRAAAEQNRAVAAQKLENQGRYIEQQRIATSADSNELLRLIATQVGRLSGPEG